MTLIPDADLAIMRLLAAGFLCPIVTVQARIEKGLFSESEFRAWFADFFGNLGLDVKGPYICPHRYDDSCPCQKPQLVSLRAGGIGLVDRSSSFVHNWRQSTRC